MTKEKTPRPKSIGKPIDSADRARLINTLNTWATAKSFLALRTRAFVFVSWGSALRVQEACALDCAQILEPDNEGKWRVRGTAYLRSEQSKGGYGAGAFTITKAAREALRAYINEGLERGWLSLQPGCPLFVVIKGRGRRSHERLTKRTAQHAWAELQKRARISQHYRVHDLRHDALTRFAEASNGHVFQVQAFGRFNDVRTAARYVHTSTTKLSEMAEIAARA